MNKNRITINQGKASFRLFADFLKKQLSNARYCFSIFYDHLKNNIHFEMRHLLNYKTACLIVASCFMLVLGSCKKAYEDIPLDQLTDQYIWDPSDSSGTFASQYLSSIYAMLPTNHNRIGNDMLDAASDDAISSQTTQNPITNIATGGITVFSNPDNSWSTDYAGIRMCSVFLQNFSTVPLKNSYDRASWFGEARVMRAFFYWELVRRYGGVPLLGDTVRALTDNVEIPRSSFQQCIEYIVKECDRATDSLRDDPVDNTHLGRWTKNGAMALKARVLLYAASDLYNGTNASDNLIGYTTADPARWQLAADAAKAIIDQQNYALEPVFQDAFVSQKSDEVIFAHLALPNTTMESSNGPIGFSTATAAGNTSPTQELADAFEMINGKSITNPTSGYKADSPYVNRDLRFAATILYNGAPWLNGTVETFDGGLSKPGGTITQTRTGYYMRKLLGDFAFKSTYYNQYHDYIYFRYAEVLLNFAEAQNESTGPNAAVYDAVEAIRERAGLNPFSLASTLSKDSMRVIIRNERRKELAFEEHRYWDIKRWKIAASVYNKPLHGIKIIKNSLGVLSYSVVPVLTTKFDATKMYFYPIPYSEITSNKNMKQNPGWK